MTAQIIIENIIPLIEGSRVSREDNLDTLLTYFNFAKSKLARDTSMWIGGETISLQDGVSEYTLSKMPLQIIEVYDNSLQIRPRNKFETLGYTQIAPNKIFVNTPQDGVDININWIEEPADYILTDEVYIPSDLVEAMQHYVAYKVFSVYKSENEELKTRIHLDQYKMLVGEYKARTDIPTIDSIYGVDMISDKGLV